MAKLEYLSSLRTAEDLCARWGIHRKTLSRWMSKGYIPGTKEAFPFMRVGRKLRWSDDQIAHIEARMARRVRKKAS
jgi:predicted site-specific integrase-resolvase